MPERIFDALNTTERELAVNYVPGYDWIPGKFGPPPGIRKAQKDYLDSLPDRDYLHAVMKLTPEERDSLMISEAERRRTFTAHWPIWNFVDGYACAKEGFFYTGVSDRVQCTFCSGQIRNWEKGDIPKQSHKNFFNYCKMVQKKPCYNIPYDQSDMPKELMTTQLTTTRKDSEKLGMNDLGICDNKPKYPSLSQPVKRLETFSQYWTEYPVAAVDLSSAGFFYEGPGDKVRCFWCDGALELWSDGDDPWEEHAKWYPGCAFTRQQKGTDYILVARRKMSPADLETAASLLYNSADLKFLDEEKPEVKILKEETELYKLLISLGKDKSDVDQAFSMSTNWDMEDRHLMLDIVEWLEVGGVEVAEKLLKEKVHVNGTEAEDMTACQKDVLETEKTRVKINIVKVIMSASDPTLEESEALIVSMTCALCHAAIVGAVVLPCGHFCLCQACSRKDLPEKCPVCEQEVKGACRSFMS